MKCFFKVDKAYYLNRIKRLSVTCFLKVIKHFFKGDLAFIREVFH